MKSNDIISLRFRVEYNKQGIKNFIKEAMIVPYKKIYAYIVKNAFIDNVKKEWIVFFKIMSIDKYNTLDITESIDIITDKLLKDLEINDKKIYLCYGPFNLLRNSE